MNRKAKINHTASELAEIGIKTAADNANAVCSEWSLQAYQYFTEWLETHSEEFKTEDIRNKYKDEGFASPPSERAWGSITRRAARAGLIKRVGYAPTQNPTAHGANASLWVRS